LISSAKSIGDFIRSQDSVFDDNTNTNHLTVRRYSQNPPAKKNKQSRKKTNDELGSVPLLSEVYNNILKNIIINK